MFQPCASHERSSCLVSSVSSKDENILNDSAAPERSVVCRQRLTRGNLGSMSPFVRLPAVNDLSIRTMRPDEISIAVNWAAAEGWNPGPRRGCLLRRGRSGRFLDRRTRRRSGRDRLLRQLQRKLRLPRLLYRARGLARAWLWTAHMGCGHCARRATRDRARWRGGAAAELQKVRVRARLPTCIYCAAPEGLLQCPTAKCVSSSRMKSSSGYQLLQTKTPPSPAQGTYYARRRSHRSARDGQLSAFFTNS